MGKDTPIRKESFMERHGYDLLNIGIAGSVFGFVFGIGLLLIQGKDLSIDNIIASGGGGSVVGFLMTIGLYVMTIWRSRKQQKELMSELGDIKSEIGNMRTDMKDGFDRLDANMKTGFDRLEAAINRMGTSMDKMATSINKMDTSMDKMATSINRLGRNGQQSASSDDSDSKSST